MLFKNFSQSKSFALSLGKNLMKNFFLKRLSYIVIFAALNLPYYSYASDFYIPDTISPHAQSSLKSFTRPGMADSLIILPSPTDFKGWRKIQDKGLVKNKLYLFFC